MMASIFLVLVLISATTSSEALGMSRLPLLRAVGHAVGHGRDRDGAVWALALTTGAHGADADSAIQASRGGGGSWRSSGGYGSSGGGRRRKRKSDVAVAVRSVRVGNTDILLTPTNLIIAANILVFALTKGVCVRVFCSGPSLSPSPNPGPGPGALMPTLNLNPAITHITPAPTPCTLATTTTATTATRGVWSGRESRTTERTHEG